MWNSLIILIIMFSYITVFADEYVTEKELEAGGFGLYNNNKNGLDEYQLLNTSLWGLKVSPDGNYIAFWTHENFYVYNLQSKQYDTIRDATDDFTWSPDSKYLLFTYVYQDFTFSTMIFSIETRHYEQFLKDYRSIYLNEIDSRGRIFEQINQSDKNDSSLYYLDFFKSLKSKQKEIVKINLKREDRKNFSSPFPVYGNEKYFVTIKNSFYIHTNECKAASSDLDIEYCSFYKMDTNFKVFSESKINLTNPDYYNVLVGEPGQIATFGNSMRITKNNEIFIYLNVRNSKEIKQPHFTNWDSSTIQARNKSGYYRMDTNCANMKQLVRMWANVGGITATGDGETIYYGYMKPNKNCVIMKMNKYGRNKEVVIDLEYFEGKSSINNNATTINNINYYPNPSKEILNIILDNETLSNEELNIYDLMGQNLLTQKIDNIQTSINIQKLNTGIYYCKLKQNGTVFKFEVVK